METKGSLNATIPLPQLTGGPQNRWLPVAPHLRVSRVLWGSARGRLGPHYQDHSALSGGHFRSALLGGQHSGPLGPFGLCSHSEESPSMRRRRSRHPSLSSLSNSTQHGQGPLTLQSRARRGLGSHLVL